MSGLADIPTVHTVVDAGMTSPSMRRTRESVTSLAIAAGESPDRLAVVSAWRETQYFSDIETAALRISEYVTNISTADLPDAIRTEISHTLSPEQIAAVHRLAVVINAFNRVAICSHLRVVPE